MAIGNHPNPLLASTMPELKSINGVIVVDENKNLCQGVYAGGDIVTGAATVILARGKKAA